MSLPRNSYLFLAIALIASLFGFAFFLFRQQVSDALLGVVVGALFPSATAFLNNLFGLQKSQAEFEKWVRMEEAKREWEAQERLSVAYQQAIDSLSSHVMHSNFAKPDSVNQEQLALLASKAYSEVSKLASHLPTKEDAEAATMPDDFVSGLREFEQRYHLFTSDPDIQPEYLLMAIRQLGLTDPRLHKTPQK